ncbi:MAG: acyl-CoA thioesterase [Clostridia bacterium]|nr:acyl-CoA thioesterase [Clostridia bacterium]
MINLQPKTPSDSYTESVQILNLGTMNGYNRLFGGKLMEWIDICAAVVARRHANRNVTTVLVDTLEFREPAYANSLVVLCGKIVYVGRTSMDVRVQSYVEKLDGTRQLINLAYLTLVALDENDNPTPVAPLALTTDEEKSEWNAAEERRKARAQKGEG